MIKKKKVFLFPLIITVYNRSALNKIGTTLSWTSYTYSEAVF